MPVSDNLSFVTFAKIAVLINVKRCCPRSGHRVDSCFCQTVKDLNHAVVLALSRGHCDSCIDWAVANLIKDVQRVHVVRIINEVGENLTG